MTGESWQEIRDGRVCLTPSFPASETAVRVEYRVNRVWDAMIEDDDAYADDD